MKLKSKNYITSLKKTLNQITLRYQKNYLQLSYNSTETSDVKTRHKNN